MTNNPKRGKGVAHMTHLCTHMMKFKNCATAGRPCLAAFDNEAYTAGIYLSHLRVHASHAIH